MKLLAIDASTAICTVAIKNEGKIFQLSQQGSRDHSRFILEMIDKCLQQAHTKLSEIDACIFGQGPGSFTGTRLTASVIQAFAFAHSLKIVPISSLQAYAQTIYVLKQWENVIVCEDAHIQQVYWTHCQLKHGIMQLITTESCTVAEELFEYLNSVIDKQSIALIGSGWEEYPQFANILQNYSKQNFSTISIATGLIQLGEYYLQQGGVVTIENALPNYVQALKYKKKV